MALLVINNDTTVNDTTQVLNDTTEIQNEAPKFNDTIKYQLN